MKNKQGYWDKSYSDDDNRQPFDEKRIKAEIKARRFKTLYTESIGGLSLRQLAYPNQADTSLCGPAAFWYCVLKDKPDLYEKAALDLLNHGRAQVRGLTISPTSANRHPKNIYKKSNYNANMSGLDWMLLAGLRDSANTFHPYKVYENTGGMKEGLAGLTGPGRLESWFRAVGCNVSNSSYADYVFDMNHPDLTLITKFSEAAKNPDCHVITLIGAGMLKGGGNTPPEKNHWIVWEGPIRVNGDQTLKQSVYDSPVKLKAFSWGEINDNYLRDGLTLRQLVSYVFGGFVASKIS